MLLSKSCEYAVRAALHVAARSPEGYTSIREVSDALGIPYPFLAKLVQTLARADILRTLRGPSGGITLARAPERITLREIVEAVDGPAVFHACVLGLPGCGDRTPCPLHAEWAPARERVARMFGAATLAETAAGIRANGFRLATTADGV